jgi:hypothetical protein
MMKNRPFLAPRQRRALAPQHHAGSVLAGGGQRRTGDAVHPRPEPRVGRHRHRGQRRQTEERQQGRSRFPRSRDAEPQQRERQEAE